MPDAKCQTTGGDRYFVTANLTSPLSPLQPRREFTAILDHRWENKEFQLKMQWVGVEPTWVSERDLHRDSKSALLDYWKSLPEGRPKNPDDEGVFEVFQFKEEKTEGVDAKRFLLTEWVGFDSEDMTWEPEERMMKWVPNLVKEFLKEC